MSVHLLHVSKDDNVTNSIQDTVCLELGMYSRTASSCEYLICQNLFQTHQLISLKESPTNKSAVRLKNCLDIGEQQRYYETLKVLEQMSDRQLNLANQVLRCMLQFEDTKREYT